MHSAACLPSRIFWSLVKYESREVLALLTWQKSSQYQQQVAAIHRHWDTMTTSCYSNGLRLAELPLQWLQPHVGCRRSQNRSSYNRSCYTVVFNVDMGWHHSNCLFCVPRSRMRRITRTTTSPLCMLIVDSCIAGEDGRGSGRQPSKSVRSPAPSHSHWNLHETLSNTLFYDCLLFRDGWKLFFFFSHRTLAPTR